MEALKGGGLPHRRDPDFYVLVEWEAVGELVDAIGGVYFDVPRRMYYNDLSQHFKLTSNLAISFWTATVPWVCSAGGTTATTAGTFSTAAYAMGDLGRIKTQQAFSKEVVRSASSPMCC